MNCFECFKRSTSNEEVNCIAQSSNEEKVLVEEDSYENDECLNGNDVLDYDMEHKKRGICLIFNHFEFTNKTMCPTRYGTDKDCSRLMIRFSALGFKVNVHNDLTFHEIIDVMKDVSSQDHSEEDCFVCCVLSHGRGDGYVFAKDHEYQLFTLLNYFAPNICPTLKGKPKIFIVQACRGSKFDDGCELTVTDSHGSRSYRSPMASSMIPPNPDFLVIYSSMVDHYAFRDTRTGTWLVQCLTQLMLDYYGKDIDFLSLLTFVNRLIAYEYKSKTGYKETSDKKQIINISHTLTKRIFFKSK